MARRAGTVLVLGAGMAGLGAARRLRKAGVEVTVIEARDRIGGRTVTSGLWPDLPVDLGASWVHGTKGNPLTKLAKKTGVVLTPTSYKRSVTMDAAGQAVAFGPMAKRAMRLVWAAHKRVGRKGPDASIRDAVEGMAEWQALSPGDRALMRMAINTRIEHEYSGDWTLMSARHFDEGKDFPGDEALLTPGYGPIVAHLARGLDLRLQEEVTAVAPTRGGVRVTTSRGVHEADHAIVTLPLGVLQAGTVAFGAPLMPERQRAIKALGFGLLNKCWMRFDRVFWPPEVDWIDHIGPVEGLWADWTNALPSTGKPLLVGFNAARVADEMEALDDRATVASAMAALRAMFGSGVPEPVAAQVTRWRQDPFARGSYSFNAVGSGSRDRAALVGADWDGRLLFAGEAASEDNPGTAHGALMTGRAMAAALIGRD